MPGKVAEGRKFNIGDAAAQQGLDRKSKTAGAICMRLGKPNQAAGRMDTAQSLPALRARRYCCNWRCNRLFHHHLIAAALLGHVHGRVGARE